MKASTQQVLIKLTNYMVHSSIVNTKLKELPELMVAHSIEASFFCKYSVLKKAWCSQEIKVLYKHYFIAQSREKILRSGRMATQDVPTTRSTVALHYSKSRVAIATC